MKPMKLASMLTTVIVIAAAFGAVFFSVASEKDAHASTNHLSVTFIPGAGCVEAQTAWGELAHFQANNNGLIADSNSSYQHTVVCSLPMTWDSSATSVVAYAIAFAITMPASSGYTCTLAAIDSLGTVVAYNSRSGTSGGAGTLTNSWMTTTPLSTTQLKTSGNPGGPPLQPTLLCTVPPNSVFRGATVTYMVTTP